MLQVRENEISLHKCSCGTFTQCAP